MKIRIIITSNESGSREEVTFTEDFDVEASDYCCTGMTVSEDCVVECDLPTSFPTEYTLMRD